MKIRSVLTFAALSFLVFQPSLRAGKVYDWDFTTSIVDSVNGVTAVLGDPSGLSASGYAFPKAPGKGITVDQPAQVAVSGTYTIVMEFTLSSTMFSYQKLIDFADYENDEGIYASEDYFQFYDYDASLGASYRFLPDDPIRLVISRNAATNWTYATVNGVRLWGFADSGNFGIFNGTNQVIHFFQDDSNNSENPGGNVTSIQVYNRALTDPSQLAAVSKRCLSLKKAYLKAKKSKVAKKIRIARKRYNLCQAEASVLRARLYIGNL